MTSPYVQSKKQPLDQSIVKLIVKVYWQHISRYPYIASIILVSIVTNYSIQVFVPWFYKEFFDILIISSIRTGDVIQKLLRILFIIMGLHGLTWFLYRLGAYANIYFQSRVMTDLLQTSFANLLRHSYQFFTNNFTGSLVRKVNRLSRAFEEITDQILGNLLPLTVTATGIFIVLFRKHSILGLILTGWVFFFLLIFVVIAIWKLKYDRAKAEKDSETTGVLSDALTNSTNIKLFSNYEHEKSLYRKVTSELLDLRIFTWKINEWMDATQAGLMVIIEFLIFYFAIKLWQKGIFTVGDFVLIQAYLLALFHRLWDFGRVIRRIYEGLADAWEMVEILSTPYDIKDASLAKPLLVKLGEVEFRNVEFRFHQTRKVLDKFNLTIRPGEKMALVGPSGAGKSTIVTLLLRMHDLDGGEILIDKQNISQATQDSLRSNIAFVPQDPILFHRTLMDNIRYGRISASDEEVVEASKKARCHEFISRLPYGYNTYVGERGIKLSGGERQRVAIARAILKNAPILVLDEATSSLDSKVEFLIQEALKSLMERKTTIVIAHRLSTIRQMDKIIVVDKGQVVAEGTHEELLLREGIYKKLWKIQAGGFVAETIG